jgi:hypothetical protein
MKVIFLDIDGVLNSEDHAIYCHKNPKFIEEGGCNWVDPYPVFYVLQLIDEMGIKLVISSSWRLWDLESTIDYLNGYRDLKPLIPYIVGVTPRNTDDRIWEDRGEEIQHYLDEHPDIENYCIVDDDNDMLDSQRSNFVRTNSVYGLTEDDCSKIRKILSK